VQQLRHILVPKNCLNFLVNLQLHLMHMSQLALWVLNRLVIKRTGFRRVSFLDKDVLLGVILPQVTRCSRSPNQNTSADGPTYTKYLCKDTLEPKVIWILPSKCVVIQAKVTTNYERILTERRGIKGTSRGPAVACLH